MNKTEKILSPMLPEKAQKLRKISLNPFEQDCSILDKVDLICKKSIQLHT